MADLIKYLPELIAAYQEYQTVCAAENPEFEIYEHECKKTTDNNYIQSMTESRIYELERMLDVMPETLLTLVQRKRRLLNFLKSPSNYVLQEVLNDIRNASISKNITYSIFYNNYEFNIECDIPANEWTIYYKKLTKMIPANMVLNINNIVSHELAGYIYTGGAITHKKIRRIGY